MNVIGINDISHDSCTALSTDGKLISASEEERFGKIKHIGMMCPEKSLNWNIRQANGEIDAFVLSTSNNFDSVFGFNQQWEGSLYSSLPNILLNKYSIRNKHLNNSITSFLRKIHKITRIWIAFMPKITIQNARKKLKNHKEKTLLFNHHLLHASSTFRCSGFKNANIITIDGRGQEDESTVLWTGKDDSIERLITFPVNKSYGIIYNAITRILNFGEFGHGKTMGLVAYGKYNKKFDNIVIFEKEGYKIDWKRVYKLTRFARLSPEISQDHKDLAFMTQFQLEKLGRHLASILYEMTGWKNICLAGGVALNCPMNGAILDLAFVDDIFIQPAAADDGIAIGAALEGAHALGFKTKFKQNHAYYGPGYNNEEILDEIKSMNIEYNYYDDIEGIVSELLAKDKIIGWFQGRMEIGPRALGNRSILANPMNKNIKDIINVNVKHRETWRPYAPSVLREEMRKYFENPHDSSFMILNFIVKPDKREVIPAVTHADGTARVQSVEKINNEQFYNLIKQFKKETGVGILLNTSFNDRGQPIVRTPHTAINNFNKMKLDYIAIGNYLLKNPNM